VVDPRFSRRTRSLDHRIVSALREVAGAPPAETIDWWSLRRRIHEDAAMLLTDDVQSRVLAGLVWWRRMTPIGIAACLVAAAIAVRPVPGMSSDVATSAVADSTTVHWTTIGVRDVDPGVGASTGDGWLAAAIAPSAQ
jgi:hypothetical protein